SVHIGIIGIRLHTYIRMKHDENIKARFRRKGDNSMVAKFQEKVSLIWPIADNLRVQYRQENYGDVILLMSVLRRCDAELADKKEAVLKENERYQSLPESTRDEILNRTAKQGFNNTSLFDLEKLLTDPDNIADNLRDYIQGFSSAAREILNQFNFDNEIDKMDDNNLLYLVIKRFSEIDLHPSTVSNMEMG